MFTGGSTIRTISVSGLRQVKIPIPPIEQQEKVVERIDQIIEAKLEAKRISKEFELKQQKLFDELNEAVGR